MKKFNLFAIGVVAMLMAAVNVSAATTATELKKCLIDDPKDTCTLVDTEDKKTLEDLVTIAADREVVLDLNGKTLYLNAASGDAITVNGSLTVKNGTIIVKHAALRRAFVVNPGATLNIDTVTIKGNANDEGEDNTALIKVIGSKPTALTMDNTTITNSSAVLAVYGPTSARNDASKVKVTINNSSITSTRDMGVTVNGKVKNYGEVASIEINDTTIKATKSAALYGAGYANWVVTGGTFTGNDAATFKSGNVKLDGGTYKATGANDTPHANGNGPELVGAAVSITAHDAYEGNVTLNIVDGIFTSTNGYALYEGHDGAEKSALNNIKIANGTFKSKIADVIMLSKSVLKGFIENGTFECTAKNTKANLPADYVTTEKGTYTDENGVEHLGTKYDVRVSSIINKTTENFTTLTFEAVEGETIDFEAKFCSGKGNCVGKYKFEYFINTVARISEVGMNKFVMPGNDVDLTVTITKREGYTLTVKSVVLPNGVELAKTVSALGIKSGEKILEGTEFDLNSLLSAADAKTYVVAYTLTTAEGSTIGVGKFAMPSADAELTIEVVKKEDAPQPGEPTPEVPTKADYSKLDAALKEAEAVVADKYTAESYAVLEEAAKAAKDLSRELTSDKQADVDAATEKLTKALAALVEKTPDKTPSEGEPNPGTLDNVTSVAAMGGISLAIAAAGIATLKMGSR